MQNAKVLGVIVAIALTACMAAAKEDEKGHLSRTVFAPAKGVKIDVIGAVYPFDALLKEKAGKVKLECRVDGDAKLIGVEIKESSGAEFSGAAIAYAEAADFRILGGLGAHGKGVRIITQDIIFDTRDGDRPFKQPTYPKASAIAILEKLRADPTGKQFARAKHLDSALVPVKQKAPVFPKALQDTVSTGEATVDFYIDEQGFAVLPRVVSASDEAFGYSACQSIDTWRFEPPLRDGKPTVVKVRIPVSFRLNPEPAEPAR